MPLVTQGENVIRAAIDIGSGGPKLRVAEVDLNTNKIVRILCIKQYPVIFHESLADGNRILNHEIMAQGISAIREAIALAKSFEVSGIVIIGASIFRAAVNGELFASDIYSATGLNVHILDQDLEGKLAFQAAQAQMNISSENLIAWDIGGGSIQFVGTLADGSYFIDGSDEGSGPFRDFIIESIKHQDLKECRTPNPLSQEQANLAEEHAAALSRDVDSILKNRIRNPDTIIVGVGTVFGRGIANLLNQKNPFTIDDLAIVLKRLIGKNDDDLGGAYACVEVSNVLLALGFMKELNIKEMRTVDVNNADGAMVYEPFWH